MADLIRDLPDILRELYEYQELFKSENPEFDRLDDLFLKWRKNFFPKEADADGMRRFEEMLEITPLPGETLEERRFRVVAKLNSRLPYTEVQLRKILASILGWEEFELQIQGLEMFLWISLKSIPKAEMLYWMLLEIVPENMLFHIIQCMQFLAKEMGAALKHRNKVAILPWQTRGITDTPVVGVGAAGWDRDHTAVLPWQPHGLNFGPVKTPAGAKIHQVITIHPPQVSRAARSTPRVVYAYMKARIITGVRPGQDPYWRYIYE